MKINNIRNWIRNCNSYYALKTIQETVNKRMRFIYFSKFQNENLFSKIHLKRKFEIMDKLLVDNIISTGKE